MVSVLDDLLFNAIKNGFEKMAENCPHKITDNHGTQVCAFHESSPGDCKFEFCPRVEAKLRRSKNGNNP
jgi:hypothetical protein